MTEGKAQLTLMGWIALAPLEGSVERGLFGARYIRFFRFLQVSAFLYESGAMLGRAKGDKLLILERMLGKPQRQGDFITYLQRSARERFQKFRDVFGAEPDSFHTFIVSGELQPLGLNLSKLSDLKKVAEEKMPLEKALPHIEIYGLLGIGFGSCFPLLTEKMYRNFYESIDLDVWSDARAHGVNVPEKPTLITCEQREKDVLEMVASYAAEYFPDLLAPLGLYPIKNPE